MLLLLLKQVWVFGGALVYKNTIKSRYFHRLYLTRIDAEYECDSFFPADIDLSSSTLRLLDAAEVQDSRVPQGLQVDPLTSTHYQIHVYESNNTARSSL